MARLSQCSLFFDTILWQTLISDIREKLDHGARFIHFELTIMNHMGKFPEEITCAPGQDFCNPKAVARGGGATGACAPPLKKQNKKDYFSTNTPKCQYVYLSFYLNDYQIIDKVNTI